MLGPRPALVTGASGFIGARLCRKLIDEGWQVRALHRENSLLANLTGLPVELCVGDITQPESLAAAMQGIEAVFHVAAQLGHITPERMQAVTVQGTRNVLEAARQAGVRRVVYTSSIASLGCPVGPQPEHQNRADSQAIGMDETHTWNIPASWWQYGYAKYLAEGEVQRAVAQGLDVVIVNPALVVGPGDIHRISLGIIEHVARGYVLAAPPGGLNVVHVSDVAIGHLAALEHGQRGERYILGAENISHHRFIEIIASVTGVRPPLFPFPAAVLRSLAAPANWVVRTFKLPIPSHTLHKAGMHFYYDLSKARRVLGYAAAFSVEQAVQDAYKWLLKEKA